MMTTSSLCQLMILGFCGLAMAVFADEPKTALPAVRELGDCKPSQDVVKESRRDKPLVLESADAAGKYFAGEDLTKLKQQIDFQQQKLLVFAWSGSGQDQLTFTIAESHPEQVVFQFKRGLTKDLRRHVRLFAVRSNVQWSVK